ncbi:hypothetical protein CAPTEDRAFT_190199 [Capitella teleta]|uniref:Uncharacterized protein n=1 Tax=Capitella teleta TaxID=283909 RepID=R7VE85_CAPTE|nr:hypothetical protein CAPTEDRAFT_190199 [Capitella teleta]|eukprot:ELU16882.1 hypothetical protein CAPTEDRAFT_190199 [Capitella teleta]
MDDENSPQNNMEGQQPDELEEQNGQPPAHKQGVHTKYGDPGVASRSTRSRAGRHVGLLHGKRGGRHFENCKRFTNHYILHQNVTYERAKLNSHVQCKGETTKQFVTLLFTLAEHCNYRQLKEEFIRDCIVVGIRDKKLSENCRIAAVERHTQQHAPKHAQQRGPHDSTSSGKGAPTTAFEKRHTGHSTNFQKCKFLEDRTVPQRMPCQEHLYQEFKSQLQEEIEANIHAVVSRIPVPEHRLKEIREGTMSDPVLQIVMTYCKEGWPQRVLDRLKPFADLPKLAPLGKTLKWPVLDLDLEY